MKKLILGLLLSASLVSCNNESAKITLGHLSAGTYVIKVSSTDNKISYQFKMVKL